MRVSKSRSRNRSTNSVVWYIFIFELAGAAGSLSLVSLHFCFAFAFRFAFIPIKTPQFLLLEHKCRSCSQSQYNHLLHSPSHNSCDSPRRRTRSSCSSSLRDCRSRSRTRCTRENDCRTTTGRCLRICIGANDWYQAGSVFGAGVCPRAGECCQCRAIGGRCRDDGGG